MTRDRFLHRLYLKFQEQSQVNNISGSSIRRVGCCQCSCYALLERATIKKLLSFVANLTEKKARRLDTRERQLSTNRSTVLNIPVVMNRACERGHLLIYYITAMYTKNHLYNVP